jgi:5-methylcytosine-specific restriction endonuclease McrA
VEVLKRQCAPEYVAEIVRKGGKLKDIYAKLLLRATCAISGERLLLTGVQWDHRIPLALGGTNEPKNIQGLTPAAHRKKTDQDDEDIARAERRKTYHETGRASKAKQWRKIENRNTLGGEEYQRAKKWKQGKDQG